MSKTIYIGGRLESKEKGNVVTGANAILDDTKGKKQNVINKEIDDELLRLEQSKQDNLNFDNAPTENSTNPVTSGGVYTAEKALSDAIEAILLLIPSAATALNKLVDTNTMNSSISTATATFRGTYNAVSDLGLTYQATHAQIEAALDALGLTADNNDFAFVQIPVSDQSQDIAKTERFKFNGTNWLYEYDLNTSGFTAAQWGAINSTITLALVQKLAALPTNAELLQALGLKQDVLTFDNAPTTDSNNPVKSGGIKNAIDTAVGDEAVARENADTALNGLIGDEKTRAEGVEGGLNTRLGAVEGSVSTIQGVIPSEATSSNKLVDNSSMITYIGTIIDNIDATFNVTSTDGHVTLAITQVNGAITSVQLTTSDIASAAALNLKASQADLTALAGRVTTAEGNITSLGGRVSTNETDIANLQQLYNNLQQSKPVPVTSLPSSGQQQGVIYRVAGTTSYSDYMWNGSSWVLMATYNNAIDDIPVMNSNNLVKSGGVYEIAQYVIPQTINIHAHSNGIRIGSFKAGDMIWLKLVSMSNQSIVAMALTPIPTFTQHLDPRCAIDVIGGEILYTFQRDYDDVYVGIYDGTAVVQYLIYPKYITDIINKPSILNNKKIACLGDSITDQGYYTSALQNISGCTILNYGVSATTISSEFQNSFVSRFSSMTNDCDIVLVQGGINDWQLGGVLGTFEDTNGNTFYSSLHALISGLKDKYMNGSIKKPIFVCTPLHSQFTLSGYDDKLEYSITDGVISANHFKNGATLKDYVDAIRKVCEFYSVPVIDLYSISNFAPIQANNKTKYSNDGLHPNANGGKLMANCIADKIIEYITNFV